MTTTIATPTAVEQIAAWHAERPEWAKHFTGRDWDIAEQIAEQLDAAAAPENVSCAKAPEGYYCTLEAGHADPCRIFENP